MRTNWPETWMAVADNIAKRSPCSRRQIGAVVVSSRQRIVATGYNGFPSGMHVDDGVNLLLGSRLPICEKDCPRVQEGPQVGYDNCITVHAEANALMFCDRRDREGGSIYITSASCISCAKLIANSGLHFVFMRVGPQDGHRDPERGIQIMVDSGLLVIRVA